MSATHESTSERYFPAFIYVILSATVVFTSLILPLYLSNHQLTYTSAWICFALAATVTFISGKKLSHSIFAVALVLLCMGMLASPIIPAFVFGVIISVGAGSAAVCSAKKQLLALTILSPLLAYPIALAITSDPLISISSLIFIVPIIAMGLTGRYNSKRSTSVALCASAEAITVFGAIAIWIYSAYGALTPDTVTAAADYFVGGVEYYSAYALKTVYQIEVTGYMQKIITAFADLMVNVSPGFIGAVCIVISYLSHSVHLGLMSTYGIDRCLKESSTKLTVSFEAALIFVAAYIMSFATDSSNMISFPATVSVNICMILMPCLAYIGIDALSALPRKLGLLGLIIWGAILIMILSAASSSFLFVFALIGSAFVIVRHIDSWAKEFYSKGDMK